MRLGEYRLAQIGRALWKRLMARSGDRPCPPEETLSAWMDDELDAGEADRIRAHFGRCDSCRERVLGWVDAVSEIQAQASLPPALTSPFGGAVDFLRGAPFETPPKEGGSSGRTVGALDSHISARAEEAASSQRPSRSPCPRLSTVPEKVGTRGICPNDPFQNLPWPPFSKGGNLVLRKNPQSLREDFALAGEAGFDPGRGDQAEGPTAGFGQKTGLGNPLLATPYVMPAEAGIQAGGRSGLDSRFRENDGQAPFFERAPASCLDEETLVAYTEAELSRDEAAHAEVHLRKCARCVGEVQRLIELRVAMETVPTPCEAPSPSPVVAQRAATAGLLGRVVAGWLEQLAEWLRSALDVLPRPWPAAALVAVTALAIVVIAGLLPTGRSDMGIRGVSAPVKFEVVVEGVPAHARPGDDEPVVATLSRGTLVNRLEEAQGWTRVELPDGRRVWVRSGAAVARATP